MKLAKEWLNTDGRIKTLSKSTVTEDRYPVEKFVCTKQKGMLVSQSFCKFRKA